MTDIILSRHRFLNAVSAAATSTAFPCDWHFSGQQSRTFMISQNAADTIAIQGTPDFEVTAATIWTQVTAATGMTKSTATVEGPFGCLRVVKTGTNGAATVDGIV